MVVVQLHQWFWAKVNCCEDRVLVCMYQIVVYNVCSSQLLTWLLLYVDLVSDVFRPYVGSSWAKILRCTLFWQSVYLGIARRV